MEMTTRRLTAGSPSVAAAAATHLLQGADARILGKAVVDQALPVLARCRTQRLVVVGIAVGELHAGTLPDCRVHDFEQQEAVEEPVRLAVRIGIGNVVGEALRIPRIGAAVVSSAVEQHQVRNGGNLLPGCLPGIGLRP